MFERPTPKSANAHENETSYSSSKSNAENVSSGRNVKGFAARPYSLDTSQFNKSRGSNTGIVPPHITGKNGEESSETSTKKSSSLTSKDISGGGSLPNNPPNNSGNNDIKLSSNSLKKEEGSDASTKGDSTSSEDT